ncbi:MAG: amino acid adenylation domain-containing protein [Pseudomonadota bacterium]
MQVAELIGYLNGKGIFPYVEDGKLKTRSRQGGIDAETGALIRASKQELIGLLERDAAVEVRASESIPSAGDSPEQPLSFNQERLWLTNQIGGGSAQYNLSQALRLQGRLDRAALQKALDAVLERHAVLRTSYHQRDGVAVQVVNPAAPLAIAERDLRSYERAAQEQAVAQAAQQQAELAFDLEAAPVLRVLLLALAADEHVLIFTLHHIASDGWSMGVLARDFVHLYRAFSEGQANPLAPLATRYIDYAAWQRSRLEGENLEAELDFWRQRLSGIPKLHNLPLDRPRAAQQQFTGKRLGQLIEPGLHKRLCQLGESQGATFFMVVQAAFALLLGRWSGEDDIVVGCPVAGRSHRELESLIGFFANAVVYRTDLSGELSFLDLLSRVKANAIDVFGHQDVPFEMLAKSVQSERSLSYSPLFQVSLTLQNNEEAELALPGLTVSNVDFESGKTLFDLSLFVRERADGIHLSWLFSDQLFDSATVARIADSFAVLLGSIVAAPAANIRQLALVSQSGQAGQLALAPVAQQTGGHECMHQLFESQVALTPDAVAVVCGEDSLTYAALNAQANQLARHLMKQGVQPDSIVGLCVERSVETLIGVLGILKAGAAYLPLDPSHPPERIAHMLEQARVAVVVTQQALMADQPFDGIATVLVDAQWRRLLLGKYDSSDVGAAAASLHGRRLAYVIYTSGSSGKPKGVMIEHAGFVQSALAQRAMYGVDAASTVLQYVSFSFDVACADWAMALSCGAVLCIAGDEERRQGDSLAALATRWNATHVQLPAPVLAQLDVTAFPTLHTIVTGGSTVSAAALAPWLACKRCFNAYGPTETVIASGAHLMRLETDNRNIGQPFAHVLYRVVDARGQLLPLGVPGELLIGGYAQARAYCIEDKLATSPFIDDPYAPGRRLYKTGDLVRYLAGGDLEFIGRVDDQVKLRGYRIELGEIRSLLLQQDAVREALVLVTGEGEHQRLAAYLVPAAPVADEAAFIGAVQARLKLALPDYMVPAAYGVLAQMPLTPNGKVDVRALPEIASGGGTRYQAPSNATESLLCDIWQQLLKAERVGVHDNFFALGGDSILAIQVVARANQAGLNITTRQLFAHQSVAELATHAGAERAETSQQAVEGGMTLLPIQRHFLGMSEHYKHFNQSVLLETPAGLDRAMLEQVMAALYARHDALRLCMDRQDGQWQASHAPLSDALLRESVLVEALPEDCQAQFISERCTALQRQFDPATGPLLRALLLEAPEGGRLFLVAHHLVVDGVSWRILLADMEQAYGQLLSGAPLQLGTKTSSYQQWGETVSGYAHSDALKQQLPYWMAQLNQPVPAMPLHNAAAHAPQSSTRSVRFVLDTDETTALLKRCSQRYRTQINELLLAGVYLGMRAWSGADGVRLMLEGHGREDLFDGVDTSQTVGWFTTTYPLALAAAANSDTGAVIRQVKEQLRAVPQRGFGYGALRYVAEELSLVQAEQENPAQLVFNYLGQFDQTVGADSALRAASEPTGEAMDPRRMRHTPLGLNGKVAGGVLGFSLDYSELQLDRAQAERLAALMAAGLREVIAHCADAASDVYTPSDFPLATMDAALLDQWQQQYRIAKLYPATSMQQGMQFHSLLDAGAYVSQCCPVFSGRLDPALFRAAWSSVVARFDIFRTVFVGQGEQLHQLVLEHASMPWDEQDWRALDRAQQQARFAQVLSDDRARGFDPSQAPLQRIGLYRLDDTRYQMLWSHHHMLLDGWCTPVVYRDVLDAYQRLASGQAASQATVVPYENYIAWLVRQDRAQARQYWRDYLAPIEAPTPLAIEQNSGASGIPAEQRLLLDQSQTARLQQFAKLHQTTVNTVLQLAWGYLLHRYSGEQHVLFGTTLSGRPAEVAGIEEMVGLFINTIPVKVSIAAGATIEQQLAAMGESFQASASFGYLPLTEIAQCSQIAAGTALFDSMLVFENYPLDAAAEAASSVNQPAFRIEEYTSFEETGYKLALSASLRDTLSVKCRYRGAVVSDAAVTRLLGHMERILLQMPEVASLDQISLLTLGEQKQLRGWNNSQRDYPQDQCLHEMFEAQAAARGEHLALSFNGESLSYAQLNSRANRMARRLLAEGVTPETVVGVCVERSLEMVVGILAILKAGGAYLPLDPLYPQARLDHIINDSGVKLVLTAGADALRELPSGVRRIDTSVPGVLLDDSNLSLGALGLGPRNLAYVIYTSGSSGLPKGVMVEHAGLVNLLHHDVALFDVGPQSRTLHCASMSFDAGTAHLFMALCAGAACYLVAPDIDITGALQQYKITHAAFPTAILEAQRRAPVPSLKALIVGGDVCPKNLVEYWSAQCRFFNVYGPTEASIASSAACLDADSEVSIGRAVANVELHVLDAAMREVPLLVPGELYISGAGLARGYLNRPELDAVRFVAGPGGKRMYRSGDTVRRLEDGQLAFMGRADEQVKIRGFRIELGEIESKLLQSELVREAVVAVKGEGSEKYLLAYVTPLTPMAAMADAEAKEQLAGALRLALSELLPAFMVPSQFMLLEQFPLTTHGKLDRAALPEPQAAQARAYLAPRSATETAVQAIWHSVLGATELSVDENFFALGGNSLQISRLTYELRAVFAVELSVKTLFATPTIAGSAALVDAMLAVHAGPVSDAVEFVEEGLL